MRLVALSFAALLSLSACGDKTPRDSPDASVTTSASAGTDADGYPVGFAFPPGATVEHTAAQHSLYVVADAKAESMKDYWDPHLSSLGFEVVDETDISTTYQHGTTTIQITWNQAGSEIRGAANVLTP